VTFLLDVNVLIALFDPLHVQHEAAHQWFETTGVKVGPPAHNENGVIRILSQSTIRILRATLSYVLAPLQDAKSVCHEFWADDISLLDAI